MNGTSSPAIAVEGLTKVFGRGDRAVTALAGIDLSVDRGAVFGLLGANGSGKSTLVRVLSTLTVPTTGTALVDGIDVVAEPGRARARIGVTAQQTTLDQRLSGRENLLVLGRLCGLSRAAARRRADELLDRYALSSAADRPVSTYSGGMRRRTDIMASLILRPTVLFLDEPTTGLDPHSRNEIWDTVQELAAEGTTVLLTTQYLDEADRLAQTVALLESGHVVAEGTPQALKERIGVQLRIQLQELPTAPATQELLRAIGVVDLEVDEPSATVSGLIAAGSLTLPPILAALTDAGIGVRDIGLDQPTLDQAYLALTGGTR
ncbi:ATP-binding cassette domain-containing protein [Georgenia subflava]|uniref:ATP-binding cassette domain-containing protein n=1 Tax=Georgenia subflava TaxID=1622177 RepID=A0A6N7EGT9_9MICO|nr:ATP-binding cassette domain-containing protein [Georgenia subflava]MPV35907.1 ATP-binding cassette domain-containing protein [Georgenia subflava]